MTNLNINFLNATINETAKAEFMTAVTHENYAMNVQLLEENIAKEKANYETTYKNALKEAKELRWKWNVEFLCKNNVCNKRKDIHQKSRT